MPPIHVDLTPPSLEQRVAELERRQLATEQVVTDVIQNLTVIVGQLTPPGPDLPRSAAYLPGIRPTQ